MNDSEKFDSAPEFQSPVAKSSEDRFEALQKLFFAMLVAVLIMSLSLNVFLVRQTIFARTDLETVRLQMNLLNANYQKFEEPQIRGFVNALIGFGQTNPDFVPILTKYKLPLTPIPSGPAAVSPAPVAPKK